nr:hypothetical protein [Micromonospora sp. DSM 115978]
MIEEFEAAQVDLELPPGVDWLPPPPSPSVEAGAAARFGEGVGVTHAELFWFCEWEKEWLAAHAVDPQRAELALSTLEGVYETQLYRVAMDEVGRSQVDKSITHARAGDPEHLRLDVQANCPR